MKQFLIGNSKKERKLVGGTEIVGVGYNLYLCTLIYFTHGNDR